MISNDQRRTPNAECKRCSGKGVDMDPKGNLGIGKVIWACNECWYIEPEGVVRYTITANNGRFTFTHEDHAVEGSSISGIIEDIAHKLPLKTLIAFRWEGQDFDSFYPSSIEEWLLKTASIRGIGRNDVDEHMHDWRRMNEQRQVEGTWA